MRKRGIVSGVARNSKNRINATVVMNAIVNILIIFSGLMLVFGVLNAIIILAKSVVHKRPLTFTILFQLVTAVMGGTFLTDQRISFHCVKSVMAMYGIKSYHRKFRMKRDS